MNAPAAVICHPAFERRRSQRIDTLNLTAHEFIHRVTGAVHYHLETPYEENVFMVAFRTVPMDSTGVAHMLEHTVLCGSERYPVRDPFFWMIRRSLNTFMNAFTTSDYTAYPFASENRKDFNNLLDVYLDAVFFSRLDPLDFAQEGHRLEFEDPKDPSTPLVYRGVVYNEMKGDNSSPLSVLYESLKAHLYPTTTYHYNSGGDPAHIPDLDYEGLKAFYRSHYHPSNAVFMTFGDIPAHELQEAFETKALSRFHASGTRIGVGNEQRYTEPRHYEVPYAVDDNESLSRKTHIVVGWLLGDNTDLETLLKCNLLSDVLLDTSASPLRLALETTDLAGAVSPLSGLEETSREMSFICGVEGSEAANADKIEALILSTLERVAEQGVELDKVEACLHQLELSQREIGGDGAPFGLQLIFSCMSAAIHRGDPIALLDLEPVLAKLRQQINDPGFIKSLVRELLLDNPHRVRLVMYPDHELGQQTLDEETARLASIRDSLDADAVRHIIDRAEALAKRQDAEEDINLLPKVGLDDIPLDIQIPEGDTGALENGMPLTSYEAGTNGLVYHQVVTAMPQLDVDDIAVLPVFTNVLSEIGSGGQGYLATQHQQHSQTGGISCYSTMRAGVDDPDTIVGFSTVSSRTLNPKLGGMVDLVKRTWLEPDFDEPKRIRELVKQMRVRREGGVTGNGHGLAMSAASASFRPVSLLHHHLSGLAGISRLRDLDDSLDSADGLDALLDRLGRLHSNLTQAASQLLLIAEPGFLAEGREVLSKAWTDAPMTTLTQPSEPGFEVPALDQAWVTSTQVNFCAMAFPTIPESHPDSAALSVLGGVLRNGFLHKVLREQGGAYGGGASHDSSNGVFRFYSYRDPNLLRTFDAFENAVQWLLQSDIEFDLVEEAILGIISGMDAPGSPAGSARQAFSNQLYGRTPAYRRKIRRNFLAVTVDDIKRVTDTYLTGKSARAVVTSDAGSRQLPGTFVVKEI